MTFRGIVTMKHVLLVCLIAILPLQGATAATAGGDSPLLMPGKHSLYQRVLSVPGARVADTPGGEADTPVVPFTAFYVYARQQQDGREWIEVGTDRFTGTSRYSPSSRSVASAILMTPRR